MMKLAGFLGAAFEASAWQQQRQHFQCFGFVNLLARRGLGQLFFLVSYFCSFISCGHDAFDGLIAAFSVSLFLAPRLLSVVALGIRFAATFGSIFGNSTSDIRYWLGFADFASLPPSYFRFSGECMPGSITPSLVSIRKPFQKRHSIGQAGESGPWKRLGWRVNKGVVDI